MVRDKLLIFVGENQARRVVNKAELSESEAERVKLEPIDEEEQEMAWLQIKEMHPLADTPFAKAFPILCCCLKLCSGDHHVKDDETTRENIKTISERLNDIIRKAGGEKYIGTSFTKDTCKKFGIAHKPGAMFNSVKKTEEEDGNPFA